MPRIFVSYRRKDSAGHAGRLFDRLREHFGAARVFRDVDQLKGGDDFVEALARAVDSCDVFILVIGRDWLDARNEGGQRRLDDPQDFIRLEVETALRRKVLLLPVLVEGAAMPEPSDLPEALSPLARRQAIELSEHRWDFDVQGTPAAHRQSADRDGASGNRSFLAAIGALAFAAVATRQMWWPQPAPSAASSPTVSTSPAPSPAVPPSGPGSKVEPTPGKSPDQPSPVPPTQVHSGGPPPSETPAALTEPEKKQPDPKPAEPAPSRKDETPPAATPLRVPDMIGQSVRTAAQELSKLGFRTKPESSSRGRGEPGTVFGQRPSPGTVIEPGGAITLFVVTSLRPNEYAAGGAFLTPGRVIDLDGDNEVRTGWDVRLGVVAGRFYLSFNKGAEAALQTTPSRFDPAACQRAALSTPRVPVPE